MPRYGKAPKSGLRDPVGKQKETVEDPWKPENLRYYRKISKSVTARTVSVSAMIDPSWTFVQIDISKDGMGRTVWTFTPLEYSLAPQGATMKGAAGKPR